MKMALTTSVEENHLGIKVKGDLGDFEIVEEKSESEDEDSATKYESSRTISTVAKLPQDIVKPSAPAIGSVSVANSENVQFGNNTYFNGPVTIKQVVHNNAEHDNPGYEHTEDDIHSGPPKLDTEVTKEAVTKNVELSSWLKLIFLVCIIVVGGICAILSVTLTNQAQSTTTSAFNEEEKAASCTEVMGLWYNISITKLFFIYLLVALLTLVSYLLLTKKNGSGDKRAISGAKKWPNVKQLKYDAEADPLLIAPNHLRIVARTDWLAKPVEKPLDPLRLPAPWVIITHTDTEGCSYQSECVLRVRLIQTFHVESRKWFDIGYNFLVAGDGSAYYGRGWDYQGAHTLGYNKYSIGIAFVGTFNTNPPPKKQVDAAIKLIKLGVAQGKIAKDYKLFGHRQLSSTISPGDKLFDIIKTWPHFFNNETDIADVVPNY